MTSAHPSSRMAGQRGYILALNIAVLAMMMVGAAYMGKRMSLAIDLARTERQRVDGEVAMLSARSQVLYLLAAAPRSRYGLGNLPEKSVALDGRWYRVGKDIAVSLQDLRGLISVNSNALLGDMGRDRVERLFATYGLQPPEIAELVDSLLDYRDSDDLKRINGAEKAEYLQHGKEVGPRNADLKAPTELSRILGFADSKVLRGTDDPVTNHINLSSTAQFNPNSADWRALVAATGVTEEVAKNLVRARRSGDIPDISGLLFDGSANDPFGQAAVVLRFPSDTVIATFRYANAAVGTRMAIKHVPADPNSPWLVQYSYRVRFPDADKVPEGAKDLPSLSSIADAHAPVQVQLPF